MKYSRIAIFSDNVAMCGKAKAIFSEAIGQDQVTVDYYCSPHSDEATFSETLGEKVTSINIKALENISVLLAKHDLIFSIHCKQIFPKVLVEGVRCINLHPGYNPVNRGWYPQVFAIVRGLPLGATLHEMSEELDAGPIIDRKLVSLHHWDTSQTAYEKIVEAELALFRDNIAGILRGDYQTFQGYEQPNLFLLKDFRNLQELDLNKQATYRTVIDHLRAMTHPPFNNAFYIDKTGKRFFVRLEIIPEND